MLQAPALIIIDMQQGMQFDHLPSQNNQAVDEPIARLHAVWLQAAHRVVSVGHISRSPD